MPTERMTAAEYLRQMGIEPRQEEKKPHKYHATKATVDGIAFDSKHEAARYQVLKAMQQAGEIRDLELQPTYELHIITGACLRRYRPDFRYRTRAGALVVEDAKGMKTREYLLKKKWMKLEHNIDVQEV